MSNNTEAAVCPLCGSSIACIPYFDIEEPARIKSMLLHDEKVNCPVASCKEAPPLMNGL